MKCIFPVRFISSLIKSIKKMSILIHILDAFAKEMRLPLIWVKFTLVKMHEYYRDKFYLSIFY